MYVSDATILSDLAAILKKTSSSKLTENAAWWAGVVSKQHLTTYNDIFQALAARGYTEAQITGWDAGPTFERAITCYWCLCDNSMLSEAGPRFIEKAELYIRNLASVSITVAGVIVDPAGTAGQVGSGTQAVFQQFEDIHPERLPRRQRDRQFWGG